MRKIVLSFGVLLLFVSLANAQTQKFIWEEMDPSNPPSERWGNAMAYDPLNDVIILFGGEDSSRVTLDETWAWDGSEWVQLFPATVPGKRQHHRMVYDQAGQRILMFGGQNGNNVGYADLWAWDGVNWQEVPAVGDRPEKRWGHTFAYDNSSGRVYMFGGYDGGTGEWFRDLRYFENNSWTFVTELGPSKRSNASMVYDEQDGVLVLHGGHLGHNNIFNDTWIWDGSSWTERYPNSAPPNPPQYDCLSMEYMKYNGFTLRFGGITTPGVPQNETWKWDGTNWNFLDLSLLPPARYGLASAYDSLRNRVVIFGGHTGTVGYSSLNDTWVFRSVIISVDIDIKPGSYPNSINVGSNGNVAVAIFSTDDFDATTIDPLSVLLAGASVRIKGKETPAASFEDVNNDGLLDLVVHVSTTAFELSSTDAMAILEGDTFGGVKIQGEDTVRVLE